MFNQIITLILLLLIWVLLLVIVRLKIKKEQINDIYKEKIKKNRDVKTTDETY